MKHFVFLMLCFSSTVMADIDVKRVSRGLSKSFSEAYLWSSVGKEEVVGLMAQPMIPPRPKRTETEIVRVAALHDGEWIAFRLRWKDPEPSEAGKLATFSDAVALEFPVKDNMVPPPVMMGGKDDPVHLFHWRYQYQLDVERGKKTIDQIYPNMTTDMYPMEFKEVGNYRQASDKQKESFVGGTAAGNPQSFPKFGVDEIFAEGFGSSAVSESHLAKGKGFWQSGEWTVYLARPLKYGQGSRLAVGRKSHVAFAVWQGGKNEVGAVKSLTMSWTPFEILE